MKIKNHDDFPKLDHHTAPSFWAERDWVIDSPPIPRARPGIGDTINWGIFKRHFWGELLRHQQASGEWVRTFAIITTDANELVAEIHDRMPLIIAPGDYARWLGEEPDPGDLMRPFPAEPMRMWPISTRVNKPEIDDPSIVEPVEPAA